MYTGNSSSEQSEKSNTCSFNFPWIFPIFIDACRFQYSCLWLILFICHFVSSICSWSCTIPEQTGMFDSSTHNIDFQHFMLSTGSNTKQPFNGWTNIMVTSSKAIENRDFFLSLPPFFLILFFLRIIGPDAPNESANDIDVKVIAITINKHTRAPAAARERGADGVSRHCIKQECAIKKKHYRDDCTTKYPFTPLLITTGGTMDVASEKWLKELQREIIERQVRVELSALLLKFTTKITSIRN